MEFNKDTSFLDMREEMKKLIDIYFKARKAALYHLNPKSHSPFESLKSLEYKNWYAEKIKLEKEAAVAYLNVLQLAQYFCPICYI